jgi:hypothetical protein
MEEIPEWAWPLLGAATGAVSNIALYKLVDAIITGPHEIFAAPGYPITLHYNDDNILNQAIGLIIAGYGLLAKDVKALGFGAGWALEEFIGKFVVEAKNSGVFGSPATMSGALKSPIGTVSRGKYQVTK